MESLCDSRFGCVIGTMPDEPRFLTTQGIGLARNLGDREDWRC